MKIHGWERIIPQLASYVVISERLHERSRTANLVPFNLFLVGNPGTNKSGGIEDIAEALGLSYGSVDCSTVDDIAELAGVVDLRANRERGEAKMIDGDLLQRDVLILDEFLNARPHVMPQFRLFMQGRLTLFGKPYPIRNKMLVMAGNLTENMEHGDANLLDSPTADRVALVVNVPSLLDMQQEDIVGILRKERGVRFERAFERAVDGIRQHFPEVEKRWGEQVIKFVSTLARQAGLKGEHKVRTAFAFEGRRAQILVDLVLAGLALSAAEPERDRKDTLWSLVHDCLTYHRLSGSELQVGELKTDFEACYDQAFADSTIESMIATTPELADKITLMVRNLDEVSALTKSDLVGQLLESQEVVLSLAFRDLIESPLWANQPAELTQMVRRIDLNKKFAVSVHPGAAKLKLLASLPTAVEQLALSICSHDELAMRELLESVHQCLVRWGVPESSCSGTAVAG